MNQNPIEKAKKTLEIIRESLSGLEFAIVGSYASHVLTNGKSEKKFTSESDIDVAVKKYDDKELEKALGLLKKTAYFIGIIRSRGYNGTPDPIPGDPPPPKYPAYTLTSKDFTLVHLIGTLDNIEEAVNIDGVNYIRGHN